MNEITNIAANDLSMTSVVIADLTGKRHDNVIRDLRDLDGQGVIDLLSFEEIEKHANNRERTIYRLPKRETLILTSGYSATQRAAIIDRWLELEQSQAFDPAKLTRGDILKLALDAEEENQRLNHKILQDKPKVEFYDEFANHDGLYGLQNAGRALHQKPNKFIQFLKQEYLFYQGGALVAKARYINQGIFEIKTAIVDDKPRPRAYITPKGLQYFAGKFNDAA